MPWNSFNREVLKALYGFAPISMHCNQSSAVRFQVCWLCVCACVCVCVCTRVWFVRFQVWLPVLGGG